MHKIVEGYIFTDGKTTWFVVPLSCQNRIRPFSNLETVQTVYYSKKIQRTLCSDLICELNLHSSS
jgi:hypothetical protein